jgi:hypothetical protein
VGSLFSWALPTGPEPLSKSAKINHKPWMPFGVLGLDLMDLAGVCYLLAPSSPERPFQKGAEMLGLTDLSPTELPSKSDEVELPPIGRPEWVELIPSYVSTTGATVMTSDELANEGSAATPPAPRADGFGDRISHITSKFVLTGSKDAYRIWKFQSAATPVEFPATEVGWAQAWTKFRAMEGQAA